VPPPPPPSAAASSPTLPDGWRCSPTATFPSYAALKQALDDGSLKGGRYDEYLRLAIARAAAQARAVNPKVLVFAGLSTNPSGKRVTAQQLFDAVQATRAEVDGSWLNIPGGGAYCPKCGEPQPQVDIDLLRMLTP
jgi:ATP phosphoribosyltransferase regulatory subunit HisZ